LGGNTCIVANRLKRRREPGDRRKSDRRSIGQDVRYKVLERGKKSGKAGIGKLLNMSGSGALFSTEFTLTEGERVELTVNWPARLNQVTPLKLVAIGCVVRAEEKQAAIVIEKYEFKTRGSAGL
jgi:PilZ domain